MYLRKSKNRFGQHADVEQEDGNEEETKILRMAGSIFAEMETGFFFGAIEETGTDWSVFLKRVAEEEEMRRN